MIGILVITHGGLGDCLIGAASHVLGKPSMASVRALGVKPDADRAALEAEARSLVDVLDDGSGVIVFTDIYGATPSNLAAAVLQPGRVEGFAGVNLPLLLRALTCRELPLKTLSSKLKQVAAESVVHITADCCNDYSKTYQSQATG